MSSLVIFFVVFVTVVVPKNVMGSISTQDIDVDKLLQLVQQQKINLDDSSDSSDSSDSDDSDTSSEDIARTGRIGGENLMEIISQIVNNKNNKQVNNNHKNRNERVSLERAQKYNNRESKNDNVQRTNKVVQILEQLFSKGFKDDEPKWQSYSKTPKKRLIPNRLLGGVKNKNADDGLDEYSKIYILLNPQAIQKSKDNKSAVNKMISKILSLSSLPSKRDQAKPKQKRYKGFAIKGDIGRRRGPWENIEAVRKSNSVYAPKDSDIEDKPKRSHNNGGSGAGHTAIPYIRHRGENIYERDN